MGVVSLMFVLFLRIFVVNYVPMPLEKYLMTNDNLVKMGFYLVDWCCV